VDPREPRKDEAEIFGYTVIDPVSVLVTHLGEVLRMSLGEVLTRDDVKELVENAKKVTPAVVEELVPAQIGYGEVQAVLRNLLREGVSIRNVPLILEVIADHVGAPRIPTRSAELVRQRLGRALCESHADRPVSCTPSRSIRASNRGWPSPGGSTIPNNRASTRLTYSAWSSASARTIASSTVGGADVVLLARSNVRRFLGELVRASLPKVSRCSRYQEVVPAKSVQTVGSSAGG
jgi:flagellar biosynthesis protein FlhA